ncbi:MAG: hypothetical protein PHD72_03010 [Patescibacteria group bacterium]|nr:hypothetical protein [Patescibacteria group bacterium]
MKKSFEDVSFNLYPIKNPIADVVANVSLVIGKFIVRGFSIRKSKFSDGLYLSPPHKKLRGGGWAKLFWTDKESWKKIERSALGAYQNK